MRVRGSYQKAESLGHMAEAIAHHFTTSFKLVMTGDHPELPQAFLCKPYELVALKDTIARVINYSGGIGILACAPPPGER
jgi:hypothetical protein